VIILRVYKTSGIKCLDVVAMWPDKKSANRRHSTEFEFLNSDISLDDKIQQQTILKAQDHSPQGFNFN